MKNVTHKVYRPSIFIFLTLLLVFNSCKKSQIQSASKSEDLKDGPVISDSKSLLIDSVPSDAKVYSLGTGEGVLTIDGSNIDCKRNVLIKIKSGTYSSIILKNLLAPRNVRIYIKNDGQVKITEAMYTDNISNVTISGGDNKGLNFGFKFENIPYRAIVMNGKINGITLRNLRFENVANASIFGERSNGYGFPYNGTVDSRSEYLKILYCSFVNSGSISFGGALDADNNEDTGLFKDVEIAYNEFEHSSGIGSVCYFSNVQDYNIHHNVVNNINLTNNNHNGIFWMQGNGKFHHNRLTNYQGNSIRAWLYSRGNSPATVEIYNNICFNSRKYGAFELQAFNRNIVPGKSTYANARIYNNTVGRMNTSRDWEGQILDLYHTGGTLEYFNNLGFELVAINKPLTNMINNMSDTKIVKEVNNKYVPRLEQAVNNSFDFYSNYAELGAK